LCQPAFALFRADREKNPVRSAERNMNPFGRRAAARFTERRFVRVHGKFLVQCRRFEKNEKRKAAQQRRPIFDW